MRVIRSFRPNFDPSAGMIGRFLGVLVLLVVQGRLARAHDIHFPDSEHATLIVEVKSDLTFPDGFDRIEISSEDGDGHDSFSWVETKIPAPGNDFTSGVCVIERGGFHNGEYRIVIRFLKGDCTIASKPLRTELTEGEIRVALMLVTKPYPEILWGRPSPIIHGTRLGPAQLDAIAWTEHKPDLPGRFIYFPGEGTLLGEGTHELSVTFVPDDADAFHTATKSVSIFVAGSPGDLIDVTDEDSDGIPFLLEEALLMDPVKADFENAPILDVQQVGGRDFLHCTFRSQSGGSGVNPYLSTNFEYSVEVSDNLSSWSRASSRVVLKDRFSIPGRGTVHVYRSTREVGSGGQEYLRIKVLRR